jgi:isoleucyl-tRNA synthetase
VDDTLRSALGELPFDDICITSSIAVSGDAAPNGAFTLPETDGVAVMFDKATGDKCQRCWKVLPDVGAHGTDGICGRCADALK